MPSVKTVIKGLECCTGGRGVENCFGCPYAFLDTGEECSEQLLKDALEVIREAGHERAGT